LLPLKNTKYLHVLEPYYHPVRLDEVIESVWHLCSHEDVKQQKLEVFIYISEFNKEQQSEMEDDYSILEKKPETSDQFFYEMSVIKSNINNEILEAIEASAFDCRLYNQGHCVNFDKNNKSPYSYKPNMEEREKAPFEGKRIRIGQKDYIYKANEKNEKVLEIYDKESFLEGKPKQVGTLEENEDGDKVFKVLHK